MANTIAQLINRDAQVLLHPASSISALLDNGPQMITGAEGCYVIDDQSRRLLDAVGGLWCVNVGYGRKELAQAMAIACEKLAYYHSFTNASNPWQVELAEKLVGYSPTGLDKVFFGSGGSDANDTLIKIAWHYFALQGKPEKVKVIARQQAYHGTSISTASLTGLGGFHKKYPLPLDFVLHVGCPHFYTQAQAEENEASFCRRLIAEIEQLIHETGADNIAAFIAEPIMAAGGIIEPPADYFVLLKKLLNKHDILLIADEVVCGFGRLGHWFGSPQLGLQPDMMSCAKGLTSGYFPMSAALISDDIWAVLIMGSEQLGAFSHGYTYSGHPVGCAVALANLAIIEREGLLELAQLQGDYLHQQLTQVFSEHSRVGEIRGRGLIAGVQLVCDKDKQKLPDPADKWPAQVAQRCRELGVIVRPLPSVGSIAISPPLTISTTQIDLLVESLDKAISGLP